MTANKYTKERKSLCEESMLVLFNILKFSSLSLVVPNLPSDTTPPNNKKVNTEKQISRAGGARPTSTSDDNSSSDVGDSWGNGRSKRAQKPEQGGSNVSYLMLPTTEGRGNHQHHEVAGRARTASIPETPRRPKHVPEVRDEERVFSDFIRRFHARNEKDSKNVSTRKSNEALPPPPHSYH